MRTSGEAQHEAALSLQLARRQQLAGRLASCSSSHAFFAVVTFLPNGIRIHQGFSNSRDGRVLAPTATP